MPEMDGDEPTYSTRRTYGPPPGENQVHEIKNNNDSSKGWPPPTNRLQRSASIRFQSILKYSLYRCRQVFGTGADQGPLLLG